ncbi:uncharacterized protein LOC109726848 isoform X2 [Ananas comosus]|uniref:Uncharacterized protein LOC109726848 isoform X2 n=1 Tax=Ananas comosus TaxID=4615 RepID=A0A6P5H300_ANACO|nr:uncharacterized protein LOC109726848 isoform X2 [Ananas comosus]
MGLEILGFSTSRSEPRARKIYLTFRRQGLVIEFTMRLLEPNSHAFRRRIYEVLACACSLPCGREKIAGAVSRKSGSRGCQQQQQQQQQRLLLRLLLQTVAAASAAASAVVVCAEIAHDVDSWPRHHRAFGDSDRVQSCLNFEIEIDLRVRMAVSFRLHLTPIGIKVTWNEIELMFRNEPKFRFCWIFSNFSIHFSSLGCRHQIEFVLIFQQGRGTYGIVPTTNISAKYYFWSFWSHSYRILSNLTDFGVFVVDSLLD